ncbi:MAG: YchJ family metal-binding protein [Kocuria sp.]|uniref:YchJ family metal-binding protein n=1 Tax=Kocuria salsicia TaxID=664639 RepID=A0ABV3KCQ8_9MICC|nr:MULTISPECIES: YchJ family metal-binding protein [Kocuria]MDO4256135.1 YchJ family metal-binding protein [Kocuria sp.]
MNVCPCGGLPAGASLPECCGPALANEVWPATAETLMRSRYTAFATGAEDHLFRTWHPRTRPTDTSVDPETRWTGLAVERVVDGGAEDDHGVVEFTASYVSNGEPGRLHEVSEFTRRAKRWMYVGPASE